MRTRGFTLIELMVTMSIIIILAAILVPNFLHARAQSQLTACKSNLKNIATALESYAVDNGGRYPSSGNLAGGLTTEAYLKAIPTCPSAGSNSYSSGYSSTLTPDAFSFYCSGDNHNNALKAYGSSPNFPQYVLGRGITDHPGG